MAECTILFFHFLPMNRGIKEIQFNFRNHCKLIIYVLEFNTLVLSLSVLVFISYLLVKFAIRKYEPILEKPVKKANPEK